MGETREQRINQFHEENSVPVVALPEGSMLLRKDNSLTVNGGHAILFRPNEEKQLFSQDSDLSFLLQKN